jgi:putative hydrolase of the HAD superfamily
MIKTILFDFGAVFLELDKTATNRHLKKYFPQGLPSTIQAVHHQYEKGEISTDDFIAAHLNKSSTLTKETFIKAWNAMLGNLPEHRLRFLKQLKSAGQYQLLLLSNTNELHINWVKSNIPKFKEFRHCFQQFYLSYEIGYRKPDASIFEYVLKENQLKAEEVLFIDDTKEHTVTAEKLGFKIWHLDEKHQDVSNVLSVKKAIL